jgi:hypothetical protein
MPIYMNPKMQTKSAPRLMKMLTGKCCFHVKTMDAELLGEAKSLLDLPMGCYKKNGWL